MISFTITAFDKNYSRYYGESFLVDTLEIADKLIKNFEKDVPFHKYYTEIEVTDGEENEVKEILKNHEYNYI